MSYLNYREYGEGQPVFILHGLLGMMDNWHSFAKELGESYRVITLDQRNHGRSFHSGQFDYRLLAADLRKLMDEMAVSKAHIIGHSMGGKALMQFLADYPDYADRSIVVDIAARNYRGGHENIFRALLDIDLSEVDSRQDVQGKLMTALDDLGVVLFLMKNLSRHPDGYYQWKANITALWENYDAILTSVEPPAPVKKPVLFVSGDSSGYIQESDRADLARLFPDARFQTIEDAGHWVHADQKDKLLVTVRAFLKG